MKKTLSILCAILLLAFWLVPMAYGVDDGGTVHYVTPLYSVTKQKTIYAENGMRGYLTGTVVRVLFVKVYDDVVFVPDGEGRIAELPVAGEI